MQVLFHGKTPPEKPEALQYAGQKCRNIFAMEK